MLWLSGEGTRYLTMWRELWRHCALILCRSYEVAIRRAKQGPITSPLSASGAHWIQPTLLSNNSKQKLRLHGCSGQGLSNILTPRRSTKLCHAFWILCMCNNIIKHLWPHHTIFVYPPALLWQPLCNWDNRDSLINCCAIVPIEEVLGFQAYCLSITHNKRMYMYMYIDAYKLISISCRGWIGLKGNKTLCTTEQQASCMHLSQVIHKLILTSLTCETNWNCLLIHAKYWHITCT